jgi:hypothetical protein
MYWVSELVWESDSLLYLEKVTAKVIVRVKVTAKVIVRVRVKVRD